MHLRSIINIIGILPWWPFMNLTWQTVEAGMPRVGGPILTEYRSECGELSQRSLFVFLI